MPKAIFKIPGEESFLCIEGEWQTVSELPEEFFVCSRFNEGITGISGLIRDVSYEDFEIFNSTVENNVQHLSKQDYIADVEALILQMKNGDFDKVVYSRNHVVTSNKSCKEVFESFCKAFPDRFTYMCIDNDSDIWLGTTPEILLSGSEGNYNTMALAGTLENTGEDLKNVQWGSKEIEEHQLVSDFIEKKLKSYRYVKSPLKTVDAGPVVHLQTSFNAIELPKGEETSLITGLNPTPAVCGFPYENALRAIQLTEQYDRKYYTGLVGVARNSRKHIYVNLRSMRKHQEGFELFLGGGLTKDSVPDNEWKETELKAKTITQFL